MDHNLFRLAKYSGKLAFQLLRAKGKIHCPALNLDVSISKSFYSPIAYNKTNKRSYLEVLKRIFIIPVIPEILLDGVLTEKRKNIFFRIEKQIMGVPFAMIIHRNKDYLALCSRFIVYEKKAYLGIRCPLSRFFL